MVEKACRNCSLIYEGNICPSCRSTDQSEDFSGLVEIVDADNSFIAKVMKIKKKAEQEAFSRYGLTYIVDEYLPAKLEESEKL